ncbi:dTDP-glucose 4,6-dehydratase [Desulfohalovibrio reitneri]|uniref:dTDP-glucose 4,6-dehydratase n=1 Tax=Desulfohalovibrio reitneri TaxID=1307759 RepID=UPI0004A6DB29|nr:GDP-mannose 4,6-dehydratase [Desulfohalovibrio reitneri]
MKTILITGGAGFIGSNFAHYIYEKYPDYRILVLDALTYAGSVENLPVDICKEFDNGRFQFWNGNVLNAELVGTLVAESDYIVHFAAESHVTRSIYDNKLFFETDVLGTQAIANAVCKYQDKVERFIHISTSEVYGTAESGAMDEEHPLNPMSPYAAAKAGADRLVYSYWSTYNIPAVIIRPFNNYGARQHLEKVIPRFVTSVILDEKLRVHGDGQSSRDFIHTDDTCRAIDMALHAPQDKVVGEVFNVGSGQHRSILSIAQDITSIMCTDKQCWVHVGNRPGQVMRHTCDYGKIKDVLGWEPCVDWDEGLKRVIRWYSENEEWWRKMLWMRGIPIITAEGKKELH